jgi:hypothetical protein
MMWSTSKATRFFVSLSFTLATPLMLASKRLARLKYGQRESAGQQRVKIQGDIAAAPRAAGHSPRHAGCPIRQQSQASLETQDTLSLADRE